MESGPRSLGTSHGISCRRPCPNLRYMLGIFDELGYNGDMSWDIIGNPWVIEILQHHLQSGRVHHAYLFLGPKGVGKRTIALRFAQALLCERSAGSGAYCGECRHCLQVRAQTDPDLYLLRAAGSAQGLKVDQIRELQRGLVLKPYQGKWKVAILTEFHHASNSAANALLKVLEEPPEHVVLLLTALTAQSLLPTIVSRCEQFVLRPVNLPAMTEALLERGVPEQRARKLVALSRGLPGVAVQWIEDDTQLERYLQDVSDLLTLLGSSPSKRFRFAERFRLESGKHRDLNRLRAEAEQMLDAWMFFWRDVLLEANGLAEGITHLDFLDSVKEVVGQVEAEEVLKILRQVESAQEAIQQYANLQLVFESLSLELPFIQLAELPESSE